MASYYNEPIYYVNNIKVFYNSLKHVDFSTLTEERIKEICLIVKKVLPSFKYNHPTFLSLMCYVAERVRISPKVYGLNNDTEKAFFYLMVCDPEFKFLEIFEAANKRDEVKEFSYSNFYIYDPFIIKLEKHCNRDLHLFDDIWARESIKR